ncbi:MAG: hypothetical protein VKI81_08345 [Synechococcaceae cyanobacterium]|nr:hypothetical protein [Synechococcaceae cyanobacterium]
MDFHAALDDLRAKRDDPLDFLQKFCEEIGDAYEITDLENGGGRSRVVGVRRSDLQEYREALLHEGVPAQELDTESLLGRLPEGVRPLRMVLELEPDRIKMGVIRARRGGERPMPFKTVDVDVHTQEGARMRCLPTLVAMLRATC